MSKTKKKNKTTMGSSHGRFEGLPDVFEAKVDVAFAPYLKFRAALRTETDDLARFNLLVRQDEMEAALIVALGKIWEEWQDASPRTVGTDASKLGPGKFPFGKWIVDLFNASGEDPPSRYAIHKAIRSRQ